MNELRGQSVFFPKNQKEQNDHEHQPTTPPLAEQNKRGAQSSDTVVSRYHETVIPSNHDTTELQTEDEMLEAIRKSVKKIGKEAATQRLTLEEKNALRAIKFTYEQLGINTSGNEIIRIGMLFILKDYQKNGENSILANVLKRLNSWYHDTNHDTVVSGNRETTVQFTPWLQPNRSLYNKPGHKKKHKKGFTPGKGKPLSDWTPSE